jgi:UrcA family protein
VNKFSVALAAAALLVAPALAHAETEDVKMVVRLHGIDLNTEAGAKAGLQTIEKVATQFCTYARPGSLLTHFDAACKVDMVSRAVASIDPNTKLAQLYRSKAPTVVVMAD